MVADLLADIIDYLAEEGIVRGEGIDAFKDTAPDTPNTLVAVYEYQGGPPALHTNVAQRSIQIVARHKKQSEARAKAQAIYNALSPSATIMSLTTDRWCIVFPKQAPFKIKVDSEQRSYYGFNIGITTYTD